MTRGEDRFAYSLYADPAPGAPPLTGGHALAGNDTPHRGASSAYMTAADLARFGTFLIEAWHGESSLLSQGMARLMTENALANDDDEYPGHGLFGAVRDGTLTVTHGGSMPGIKARLRIIPEARIAYALLFNHQDSTTEFWFEEEVLFYLDPALTLYGDPLTVDEELRRVWSATASLSDGTDLPVRLHLTGDELLAAIGDERVALETMSASEGYRILQTEGGTLDLPEVEGLRYRLGFEFKRQGEELIGNLRVERRPDETHPGGAYSYPMILVLEDESRAASGKVETGFP